MLKHRQVTIADTSLHIAEAGPPDASTILFLHGYPEDWHAFEKVVQLSSVNHHAAAIDLPGIGGSKVAHPPSSLNDIAKLVHTFICTEQWHDVTLVGHDIGGMITFTYLTLYNAQLAGAAVMDTVVPGIYPWEKVQANPHIWHFAFHSLPKLPEQLVQGKQAAYFDYFFDVLAAQPQAISHTARQRYAEAYTAPSSLTAGFNWYRALDKAAEANAQFAASSGIITTPVLYIRGEKEGGTLEDYCKGLRQAGVQTLQSALIPRSGHFTAEENPQGVWDELEQFIARNNTHA